VARATGIQRGPAPIGALIHDMLRDRGLTRRSYPSGMAGLWAEAVGAERAASTRVAGLRGGVLTVEVESPTLRCELETFHRDDLIDRLRVLAPDRGIRQILFRLWGRRGR
jgi:hypothetical protein